MNTVANARERKGQPPTVPVQHSFAARGDGFVAGAMSWFSVKLERAREQRRTVEAIIRLGGTVGYDFDFNPAGRGQTSKWLMVLRPSNAAPARWLCDWFGDRLSFRRLGG